MLSPTWSFKSILCRRGVIGRFCQTRAGAPRTRDAWRKFTEIYGNPRGAAARARHELILP
jgi:hypothetical protein